MGAPWIAPKAMAGAGDEHVFERRLAAAGCRRCGRGKPSTIREIQVWPSAHFERTASSTTLAARPKRSRIAAASCCRLGVSIVIESPPTCDRSRRAEPAHEPAFVQYRDAVRTVRFVEDMRREHDRCSVSRQLPQVLPQVAARGWIEPGARLVEEQQRGDESFPSPAPRAAADPPDSRSVNSLARSRRAKRRAIRRAAAKLAATEAIQSGLQPMFSATVNLRSRLGA